MIEVISNFVGYCSDSGIAIFEANAFCRYIESWEYDGIVLRIGVFSVAISIAFVSGGVFFGDGGALLACDYVGLVQVNIH